MSLPQPPAAARWLLECAGVEHAIAGDLTEGFAARPSTAWFWRQTIVAVAVSWTRTLSTHRWLAARAVGTGWVVWALLWLLTTWIRQSAVQAESAAVAIAIVRYGDWIVIGWVIGMLHRPYAMPMVLAYVAFTVLMSIPAVTRAAVDLLGHPSYAPPSTPMLLFAVASLLAGGAISAASARHAGYPSRAADRPGR
ncbi:MAG TPA: hypothetical protein VG871_19860 [Vicinamibacterales bacterium]|nr:hypothetical protein [Vicinamibacterales bacterium]